MRDRYNGRNQAALIDINAVLKAGVAAPAVAAAG
jgi:hypothetical protein